MKGKRAMQCLLPFIGGFSDELEKIANLSGTNGSPTTMGEVRSTLPRNTMKSSGKYSKVHSDLGESPVQKHQPLSDAPSVRS